MSRRSRYKQRNVQSGRAQAKLAASSAPVNSAVKKEPPQQQRAVSVPKHKRKILYNFIGWLAKKRVAATIGALGLLAGVIFGVLPYIQSNSPTYIIGPPIPAKGGQSPVPLFHNKPSARVHETQLILYSFDNAVKYGTSFTKGPAVTVLNLGPKQTSWCTGSNVLSHRRGAYRCEITSGSTTAMADPCFSAGKKSMNCQVPGGSISYVNVMGPSYLNPYHASLFQIGRQYPWRLTLANGVVCSWNWLPFRGHQGGGWICLKAPNTGLRIAPARDRKLVTGRSALRYNSVLAFGINTMYYAEKLVQGNRRTWSVLLEGPNNLGVFHRVSVLQAWY